MHCEAVEGGARGRRRAFDPVEEGLRGGREVLLDGLDARRPAQPLLDLVLLGLGPRSALDEVVRTVAA